MRKEARKPASPQSRNPAIPQSRNPAIPQSRNPAIPQSRNWESQTIFTGDNLDVMRGMNTESVDLIYLDPPFNSKRNYEAPIGSEAAGAAFKDAWTLDDVDVAWIGLIAEKEPALVSAIEAAGLAQGKGMQAYLTMMAIRLLEMRRILKVTGSIYLHCDPTAGHYLKLVMDCVFGQSAFRSEIAWKRSSAHNDAKQGRRQHGRIHDLILYYTKSDQWTWNVVFTAYDDDYVKRFYRHVEEGTGRRYRLGDLTGPGGAAKGNPKYEVMGVTRYWRYSEAKMRELVEKGLVVQSRSGAVPQFKRYLDEQPGMTLQDFWSDIKPVGSRAKERVGYPTQKPLALLDRIIEASSNPGDMVGPVLRVRDDVRERPDAWSGVVRDRPVGAGCDAGDAAHGARGEPAVSADSPHRHSEAHRCREAAVVQDAQAHAVRQAGRPLQRLRARFSVPQFHVGPHRREVQGRDGAPGQSSDAVQLLQLGEGDVGSSGVPGQAPAAGEDRAEPAARLRRSGEKLVAAAGLEPASPGAKPDDLPFVHTAPLPGGGMEAEELRVCRRRGFTPSSRHGCEWSTSRPGGCP